MWKWISRLLSPTLTDQAQPTSRVELAALVDLNMTELNAGEARALLAQDLALPNQLHQRLVGFSSAADALLDNARTIPAQSPDWEALRRSARLLNAEFEVLRRDLHRTLQQRAF